MGAATTYTVGFDGSAGARAALRWALTTAAGKGTPVEALAAWTMPMVAASAWPPLPVQDLSELRDAHRRQLEADIAEVRAEVPGAGPVELRVVEGSAGPTLVRESAGSRCLVMGRRGHGGFAGLLLGSVADHCAHHAEVPVALVPPGGGATPGAVVVGIDGSSHAAMALRWGADEAARLGRHLVALYAWDWLDQPGPFDPTFDAEAARRYAEGCVAAALGEGCAEVVVDNDHPARALMRRSAHGDLVVVGSRGMGSVRQALLGSVSRQLAHHAPAAVIVVRQPRN